MARKARDYKAEYARRVASAKAGARPLREARGHKDEPAERKARRARTYREHGISPERLSKLRRQFKTHILNTLGAAGTKGRIDVDAVDKGVRLMTTEMLQELAGLSADNIKDLARLSYQAFIMEYPELENDAERNPFWYHP